MSKRKPQIILKADERSTVLQLGRERKFVARKRRWGENRVSFTASSPRSKSRTRGWVLNPLAGGAAAGVNCFNTIFSRRLKRPTWHARGRGAGGVSEHKRTVCLVASFSFRSSVSKRGPERKGPNAIGSKATGGGKSLTYCRSNCIRSDCVVEFAFGPGGRVWSEVQ